MHLIPGNLTTIEITSPAEIGQVAKTVLGLFGDYRVFAFYGEMGAGKTTLIKELCGQIGSTDNVSSPTFSIINEYAFSNNRQNDCIYHIDLFRLKNVDEAVHIGINDYLSGKTWCFVEWPDMVEPLLHENTVKILMEHSGEQSRKLTIHNPY